MMIELWSRIRTSIVRMLGQQLKHPGALTEGYVVKGGTNDLRRWEAFGGTLKRPPPPAPINVRETARRNGLWALPPEKKKEKTMTTSVTIKTNGQYRTTVRQTSEDGSVEETVIEGNYNGGPGEHTFYLRHPATGTFDVSEEYVKDDDKREHDGKAFATHRISPA